MDRPLKILDEASKANGDEPTEPSDPAGRSEVPGPAEPDGSSGPSEPLGSSELSEPPLERRPSRLRRGPLRRRTPPRPAARFGAGRVAQPQHRNPTWLVAGVLLVVLSALGGVLLFAANDNRIEVLVTAADLQPGVRLARTDLRIARVAVDSDVATVAPDAATELIGRQAVGRVPAGTMLSSGMFADELPLAPDEVVIGAALDPGEAPLSGLQVGSRVELVVMDLGEPGGPPAQLPIDASNSDGEASDGPDATDDEPAADDVAATPIGVGTVWAVEPIATGQLWVSVRVQRDVGLEASQASAIDALRIVLVGGAGA